jgi:hypothetical protein
VGLLWLTRLEVGSSYTSHVLPAICVLSIGIAFVFIPIASTALHGIGHEDAGVGSALINTSQQIGGAVGVALLNTVAVTTTTAYLASHGALGQGAVPAALTAGYTRAFMVGSGMLVLAAVVAFFMLTVGKDAVSEGDETPVAVG